MKNFIQKYNEINKLTLAIGFLSVVYANIVIPSYITMVLTLVLFCICIYKSNFIIYPRVKYILKWYGLFTSLTIFGLLYTCNFENPDYTIKRVIIILSIVLMASMRLKCEKDVIDILKGIVFGALFLCVLCIFVEIRNLGFGLRIGELVTGSATSFSGALLVGFIATFLIGFKNNFSNKMYLLFGMSFLFFILISGSRKPLILSIFYILCMLMFNPEVKKSRKFTYILAFGLVFTFGLAMFSGTNEFTSIIYGRIQSMINAFLGVKVDASMKERNIMRQYGFLLFKERPLLGWGTHGFAEKFSRYYGSLVFSHCGFTEILSCYGIVGFIIYYSPFLSTIKKHLKLNKSEKSFYKSFFCIYIFVTLITEYYSISFYNGAVVLMLTIGFLLINGYLREK